MQETIDTPSPVLRGMRIAFAVGGILAAIVGVLILVWPARTAMVITVLIAIYALTAGLVYVGLGIWATQAKSGWARVGYIVLGVVFVIAGIVALSSLGATTLVLAVLLGMIVGIMWIVEGIVALVSLRDSASRGWTIFFALLSIVAGIVMLITPLWGIETLYWLLGISLVVLGIVQVVRAISFGKK